jgi:hypothetical protein
MPAKDCRRIYRRTLRAGRAARRHPLCARLQPAQHYKLKQVSKSEILRKLKQRFGAKTIREVPSLPADWL